MKTSTRIVLPFFYALMEAYAYNSENDSEEHRKTEQAQKVDLSFSIHLKKANLKEFIFEIEKASGYSFIYGEEIIFKHPITLSLRKAPLSLILQKAFAGQNISFKINKNHIY